MISVQIRNAKNEVVGTVDLSEEVFNVKLHRHVIYEAVRAYRANQRQGTVKTKTRAEVSGSGRKPWKQKGTGRARSGSVRSPVWRHGGTVHGPKPRDYRIDLPKKVRRLALRSVLSDKLRHEAIMVLDELKLDAPKSKQLASVLKTLGVERKVLIVANLGNDNLVLAARNSRKLRVMPPEDLNAYEVLLADRVLFTRTAIEKAGEMFKP